MNSKQKLEQSLGLKKFITDVKIASITENYASFSLKFDDTRKRLIINIPRNRCPINAFVLKNMTSNELAAIIFCLEDHLRTYIEKGKTFSYMFKKGKRKGKEMSVHRRLSSLSGSCSG